VNSLEDKFCGGCAHALRSSRPVRKPAPSPHTSTVPIDISELLADGPEKT
jgi:hypothetical protein